MAGGVGHTGDVTNPHPWRGRCQAGYSNTSEPPLSRKRAPYQKKIDSLINNKTENALHNEVVIFILVVTQSAMVINHLQRHCKGIVRQKGDKILPGRNCKNLKRVLQLN